MPRNDLNLAISLVIVLLHGATGDAITGEHFSVLFQALVRCLELLVSNWPEQPMEALRNWLRCRSKRSAASKVEKAKAQRRLVGRR